jgi:transglutaminase/protease-like cytokinesis protein 3
VGRQVFTQPNHAWNAVRIEGQWRLLDSTWGAGYLSPAGEFVRAFNAHYFLTPPELFIYDHLPEDPQWQLLDPPISMQRFVDTVQTYPALFRYQLGLTNTQAHLVVPNSLTLTFSAPADVAMMARVKRNGTEIDSSLSFTQRENEAIVMRALLPQVGKYEVTLFAKSRLEEQYTSVLTYEVEAYLATSGPVGFPHVYGGFDALAVRLHAPLQRHLRAGVPQLFRLEIPNATEVLIATDGAMTPLTRTGALFAGEVVLRPGEVQVAVRLPDSGASLDVVLAYQASI